VLIRDVNASVVLPDASLTGVIIEPGRSNYTQEVAIGDFLATGSHPYAGIVQLTGSDTITEFAAGFEPYQPVRIYGGFTVDNTTATFKVKGGTTSFTLNGANGDYMELEYRDSTVYVVNWAIF
jgi:hypothetical protein